MSTKSLRTFETHEAGGAIVVTALSAGFGAVLMTSATAMARGMSEGVLGDVAAVQTALLIVAWIFLGLALFVGGIVTVNTFGTIIAGRAKKLALLRLLGASAQKLRKSSAIEGFIVGIFGAMIGLVIGAGLTQLVLAAGRQWWGFSEYVNAPWFSTTMIAPTVAALAVTTLSAWIGSKAILQITPIQALGSAQTSLETPIDDRPRKSATGGIVLILIGLILLFLGALMGLANPGGILVAFPGGVISFIGFMMIADRIIPPLLSWGGSLGKPGPARLAARNTSRNPKRTTRSTLGIVIGVGLIAMFTVFGATYAQTLTVTYDQEMVSQELLIPAIIVLFLVGFSTIVASVGLVNSLSLSAIQRRREIALLRSLGLTKKQVKQMSFIESARMTVIATIIGLFLGVFYGYVGAVSFFGLLMKQTGSYAVSLPWQLVVGCLLGAFLVATTATFITTNNSIKVKAVEVLAAD